MRASTLGRLAEAKRTGSLQKGKSGTLLLHALAGIDAWIGRYRTILRARGYSFRSGGVGFLSIPVVL